MSVLSWKRSYNEVIIIQREMSENPEVDENTARKLPSTKELNQICMRVFVATTSRAIQFFFCWDSSYYQNLQHFSIWVYASSVVGRKKNVE